MNRTRSVGQRRPGWLGAMWAAAAVVGLFGLAACQDSGDKDDPVDDYGMEQWPFNEEADAVGKEDNAGVAGPLVNTDTSDTQVWTARNKWEDRDTTEARQAGIAWGADSGLNWDEKYALWIQSMEKIAGYNTYYETFTLTTPWAGRTFPAPKLECAELAIFLRVTFASWYGLPFYMTAVDSSGTRIYFGHFGARTRTSRYQNTPRYAQSYRDYSSMSEADIARNGWPKDTGLRSTGLYGGQDDMEYIGAGCKAGCYFDEIFLNKRAGHFMRLILAYFGSMHLASSRNTYNLKPQSLRAGDVLIERWQRQGIGHTLVTKQVVPLGDGKVEAQLMSGSMPRRQPKWEDAAASKQYYTNNYCGGEGTNSDGEEYVKLGGGIKRWRVTKNIGGYWTNTWMSADEASWVCDTDYERLKRRPSEFEDILGEVDPAQLREAFLRMIEDARNHLRQYPASCAARTRREEAFTELYELNQNEFGVSAADTDRQYRILDDYAFAELEYEQSKTCCWNSTTSAMYQVIMDYNRERQTNGCQEAVVFKAMGGGYNLFSDYAQQTGRGHLWVPWSEDEPCPQRDTSNDVEKAHSWIPWCEASQGGGPQPGCQDDENEPNDNPTAGTQVSAGFYQGLQICQGNDDYFTVDVSSGGTITATIQFNHQTGDLDMTLFRGSEELQTSQGTGDQETVSASGSGTYTVRVYGYNGAEAAYDLQVVVD